jgi:hypothetical protein
LYFSLSTFSRPTTNNQPTTAASDSFYFQLSPFYFKSRGWLAAGCGALLFALGLWWDGRGRDPEFELDSGCDVCALAGGRERERKGRR